MPSYRKKGTEDLHGNAPDCSGIVLLLVDVISDLDFFGNEDLVRKSEELAGRIAGLSRRCREAGIPVIYVNDNKGRWRSDFSDAVAALAERLRRS
jgi:nicotinamidase-related amidase